VTGLAGLALGGGVTPSVAVRARMFLIPSRNLASSASPLVGARLQTGMPSITVGTLRRFAHDNLLAWIGWSHFTQKIDKVKPFSYPPVDY